LLHFDTSGAACKGRNTRIWFPEFFDSEGEEVFDDGTIFESFGDTDPAYQEGKRICTTCPIIERCLEYAMESRIRYGLFGGLTPIERRRIERRDRRRRLQERRRREAAGFPILDDETDAMVDDV
jgi:WhiB family redox-sensing transcriptional regulator